MPCLVREAGLFFAFQRAADISFGNAFQTCARSIRDPCVERLIFRRKKMGWTCTSNEAGKSAVQMLRDNSGWYIGSTWASEAQRYEVVALQAGGGGVYGILRCTTVATGAIFDMAVVILVQRARGEFCWKEMDEFSAPGAHRMPRALFRRLTPLHNLPADECRENANAWRAQVRSPRLKELVQFRRLGARMLNREPTARNS